MMIDIKKLDFDKMNGLLPAIIIDFYTGQNLMLGFMNEESLQKTVEDKKVTFYSRSKGRIWQKGETSGNYLIVKEIKTDCDDDTLLIKVIPQGPTCHTGNYSCFGEEENNLGFLKYLYDVIAKRKIELPENSYTTSLFKSGENRIIQKVGEEAIETVIAAKNNDREELINEVSDLLYHLTVLLVEKEITIDDITKNLRNRHK